MIHALIAKNTKIENLFEKKRDFSLMSADKNCFTDTPLLIVLAKSLHGH